jgi:hypothetical protein
MRHLKIKGNLRVMVETDMATGVDMVTRIDIVTISGKIHQLNDFSLQTFAYV